MITAGMLLLCMVKISNPGTYGSFIKGVPVKVLYVTDPAPNITKQALITYDFAKAPGIEVIDKNPVIDLIAVEDLESETYMRCKKVK